LRAGDSKAGALLTEAYRRNLVRFCWGYLKSKEEAEDAVQDVFCKVLSSQTVPDDFRAWIYRIARNRCLDILRSRSRRRDDKVLPTESKLAMELTGNLTRMVRRELHSKLLQLLEALPMHQREVLHLRYTEGLSRAEVAQVLDIPANLVKSRLFKGLQKLRAHKSLTDSR
jgi:RNA polymerase sigma-70 factor (ECF subfamily)